jgi:hypothetical protein
VRRIGDLEVEILGVYEDRSVLDVRKVKKKGEISGGKCDNKFIAVRQIDKFGKLGRSENLGG